MNYVCVMAKQVGAIKITGTFGNISFYKSEGQYLVRRKGGPTRQQVKNGKNFVRVRENYNEFGNCSKAGRLLRQTVKRWSAAADGELYRRLTQLLMKVKNHDTASVRGQRVVNKALKNESGKELLRQFDFNKYAKLNSLLLKPVYVNGHGQICVDELLAAEDIVFAKGCSRVFITAVCVPIDFESGIRTEHDYEELLLSRQDKKQNARLQPKNSAALMSAGAGELFYFLALEFDNTVKGKHHVLCLLDVNTELYKAEPVKRKRLKKPVKIYRIVKTKEIFFKKNDDKVLRYKEAPG